ncbi:septal ring lytic transglycosylase RlpA family protein [Flavobacterium sp.]|uniref:septal ring lytic transglycosylase RlpA family protein n=1 Tax=Flavobacterium sp. TaxID=239 RepID=UPI00262B48F8|nr:septal ring lytic transglycosylase RlpA family protein [Flavobacterium sp.]MDG2433515.1 septal ring lytic transglycosylase RlpA family protein [Flavobacterium sp.]
MKKSITLLLLFFVFTVLTIRSNGFVEKPKVGIRRDTLKRNKLGVLLPESSKDSVDQEIGKLKFYKKNAHASYYADKFHGKRTASGAIFDKNKLTAAHKKLPFGTKVKVTNEANGKFVIVEITDRGPFVRSREIDLSQKAFMDIVTNKGAGSMLVTIEVLVK